MLHRRFLLAALAFVAGCGPSVVIDASSSGNSSAAGDAGAAGTASTTANGGTAGTGMGGAGGTTGSAGFGGFGGDIIGTGGASPGYCDGSDYYFDISGDGPDQHYDITCQPAGWLYLGGGKVNPPGDGAPPQPPPPNGPVDLHLSACPFANTVLLEVSSYMAVPGATDMATFVYKVSNDGTGKLNITEFGDVGQAIAGEYGAVVSGSDPGSPTYTISGKFRVCRTMDIALP